MSLYKDLKDRGLIQDATENLQKILDEQKVTFYIGADPTADSLHIGHLLGYITAKRLTDAGHKAILIIGGGTSRIGDPKPDAERPLLSEEEVEKNKKALVAQVKKLLGKDTQVVDNYEWLGDLKLISFLRDIGKHFTVNNLIKKDAISARLKSDIGLSYTEFAYPLLQATDFLELFRRYNCILQIGGSDQWGNIVAGVELIRKKECKEAHAFTIPLLVDKSTGKKFGKSEGNAIWLDENKTSAYKLYQFFINQPDEMMEDLFLKLSLRPLQDIEDIIAKWKKEPHKRLAQKELGFEIVSFVHGEQKAKSARKVSEILFGEGFDELDLDTKEMLISEAPSFDFEKLQAEGLLDLLVKTKLANSKREAKEFLQNGAVKNFDKKLSFESGIDEIDFISDISIIKRGKKNLAVLYKK